MKKCTIILLLTIFPFISFAQYSNIDGFWGLKFGMSREEVLNKLVDKIPTYQIDFNRDNSSKERQFIILQSIEFGGEKFDQCFLDFNDDQLYMGSFEKIFNKTANVINFQKIWEYNISSKYGKSTKLDKSNDSWSEARKDSYIMILQKFNDDDTISAIIVYKDKSLGKETKQKIDSSDM